MTVSGAKPESRRPYRRQTDPSLPLVPKYREKFARAFLATYDGPKAAREAGYGPHAHWVWLCLLEKPDVQARMRALGPGRAVQPVTQTALRDELRRRAFMDFGDLFVPDPESGGVKFDLTRATPEQLSALRVRHVITRTGDTTKHTTTCELPDQTQALMVLAKHMGLTQAAPNANTSDELLAAARAINAASPVATPEYIRTQSHRIREFMVQRRKEARELAAGKKKV